MKPWIFIGFVFCCILGCNNQKRIDFKRLAGTYIVETISAWNIPGMGNKTTKEISRIKLKHINENIIEIESHWTEGQPNIIGIVSDSSITLKPTLDINKGEGILSEQGLKLVIDKGGYASVKIKIKGFKVDSVTSINFKEAETLSKEIFKNINLVEKKAITRQKFDAVNKPNQKKLDSLILKLNNSEKFQIQEIREKLANNLVDKMIERKNK